jgi:hypothetical protein
MTDSVERTIKGGRAAFFENSETDRLLSMLMRLATEHWALKERMLTLEKLLDAQGIVHADALEAYRPDAETDALWDQESFTFVQAVIEAGQNIDRKNKK